MALWIRVNCTRTGPVRSQINRDDSYVNCAKPTVLPPGSRTYISLLP